MSGPLAKTGALNASDGRDTTNRQREQQLFIKTMQKLLRLTETYSGSVLSHQPQVVAEQRADADAEEGGHDEEEQDVELGVRVGQLLLQKWEEIRGNSW